MVGMNLTSPIDERKKSWRQQVRSRRQALPAAQRQRYDAALVAHLDSYLKTALADAPLAAYLPLPQEPGGSALSTWLATTSHEIWLPRVVGPRQLAWGCWDDHQTWRTGAFGIREPEQSPYTFAETTSAALIVPGLGATPTGRRLGQGGGFYDQLLATTALPTMLLLYSWEIDAAVPYADHDCQVAVIITEEGMHTCT